MRRPALGHVLGYTALTVILTAGAAQSLAGSNTVTSGDIVDGGVGYADLKNNAVGGAKLINGAVTGDDVNEFTLVLTCPTGLTKYGDLCATTGRTPDSQNDAMKDCGDERLRLPSIGEAVMLALASNAASGWTSSGYFDGAQARGVANLNPSGGLNTYELEGTSHPYRCVTTVGARP